MVEQAFAPQERDGSAAALPQEDAPPQSVTDDACRAALERVLASVDFAASPRLADFLRFIVEATLEGRAEAIKGYTIAVEALGRPASFDPQSDPIVRVEATRLRRALERYYATAGAEDPVVIDVPKGGYVPRFLQRAAAGPLPQAGGEPIDGPSPPPEIVKPPRHGFGQRSLAGVALAASVVVGAVLLGAALNGLRLERPAEDSLPIDSSYVRLPMVEVRPFEVSGLAAPAARDLRAIEERMRDAFARFDFVKVKAAGTAPEASSLEACGGASFRSVFSLAGLVEGRADGSFSLVTRLTDRCDGSIVWSTALDGLQQGAGLAESERRVVHEIAAAIMENYGVIPVRARAQVIAKAPGSGFGCIAGALTLLRQDAPQAQRATNAPECLGEVLARDPEFALGHAVRAMSLLGTLRREGAYVASEGRLEEILDAAERAVELAPVSAYAARTLALAQLFAGEADEAIATAERAVQLNPLDFEVASSAAIVFIGAGRVEAGEALLHQARHEGAVRTPLQDAFLGFAAFLRDDALAAQTLMPQLALHPALENRLALALAQHTLGRSADERETLANLELRLPDGAEGVRQMVQRLMPSEPYAHKALAALESAGLSPREAVAGKPPRG